MQYATELITATIINSYNWLKDPTNNVAEHLKLYGDPSEYAEVQISLHRAAGHTYAAMDLAMKYDVLYISKTVSMIKYVQRQCCESSACKLNHIDFYAAWEIKNNPEIFLEKCGRDRSKYQMVIFDPWLQIVTSPGYTEKDICKIKTLAHEVGEMVVFLG